MRIAFVVYLLSTPLYAQGKSEIPLSNYQGSIAISNDQELIVTGGDAIRVFHTKTPHLWDAKTVQTPALTYCATSSPGHERLFAMGEYNAKAGAVIRVLKAGKSDSIAEFKHTRGYNCVGLVFVEGGKSLLSLGTRHSAKNPRGELILWDVETRQQKKRLELPKVRSWHLALSSDQKHVALTISNNEKVVSVRVYDLASWRLRHNVHLPSTYINSVTFLPRNSGLLVTAMQTAKEPAQRGQVWLIDPERNQKTELKTDNRNLMFVGLTLSPDGKSFAVRSARSENKPGWPGFEQPEVQLRNTKDGHLLWRTKTEKMIQSFAFVKDSSRLFACGESEIVEFDCKDGTKLRKRSLIE